MRISFECKNCEIEYNLTEELCLYKFDYGLKYSEHELAVKQAPAWCASCKKPVMAEVLPDVKTLKNEITCLESGKKVENASISMGWDKKEIPYIQEAIYWMSNRKSGPKCLKCGSPSIVFAGKSNFELTHPACGLNFESSFTIMSYNSGKEPPYYNGEGEMLANT